MGVSYSVYVGPFIEAPNPKLPIKEEFYGCNNTKCNNITNLVLKSFVHSVEAKLDFAQRMDLDGRNLILMKNVMNV